MTPDLSLPHDLDMTSDTTPGMTSDLFLQNVLVVLDVLIVLQQLVLLLLAPFTLLGERDGHVTSLPLVAEVAQLLAGVRVTTRAGRSGRGGRFGRGQDADRGFVQCWRGRAA